MNDKVLPNEVWFNIFKLLPAGKAGEATFNALSGVNKKFNRLINCSPFFYNKSFKAQICYQLKQLLLTAVAKQQEAFADKINQLLIHLYELKSKPIASLDIIKFTALKSIQSEHIKTLTPQAALICLLTEHRLQLLRLKDEKLVNQLGEIIKDIFLTMDKKDINVSCAIFIKLKNICAPLKSQHNAHLILSEAACNLTGLEQDIDFLQVVFNNQDASPNICTII